MKEPSVFVTYNPGNEFEQTLAIRLHTIGGVHGFNMLLPDRFGGTSKPNSETIYRIRMADYFIFFSTSTLTSLVKQEIDYAFEHLKDKSRIIIIYNKKKNLKHNENCTEIYIDSGKQTHQEIVNTVIDKMKASSKATHKKEVQEADVADVLGGILLVGLGLMALDAIVKK